MADDPRIQWKLLSRHGILISEDDDAWWSGHVNDVLELDGGDAGLLVGTEKGGVWMVDAGNSALPLSDGWERPDINCLAEGPDGPRHFFAGTSGRPDDGRKFASGAIIAGTAGVKVGGGLSGGGSASASAGKEVGGAVYESDASALAPLLSWNVVELPAGAGNVRGLAVMKNARRIIAACDGGLYWSHIPSSQPRRGCLGSLFPAPAPPPRQPFAWKRAEEPDNWQDGYYSVAVGASDGRAERAADDLRNVTVIVGGRNAGVFVGRWRDSGDLALSRAKIFDEQNVDQTTQWWGASSTSTATVAVCENNPRYAYAAISLPDGRLKMVARSEDGGRRWKMTAALMAGPPPPQTVQMVAGDQGVEWNNCVGVMPSNRNAVAVGWRAGTFFSHDGGKTWKLISGGPHLHPDIHVVRFKPTTADFKHYLYVGGDGGVARVDLDDFLAGKVTARSDYNRLLPTHQCYSTYVTRQFYGTLAVSHADPTKGWVGAGTQDNGNIYLDAAAGEPWRQLAGGDGGWTAFLEDGNFVHNILADFVRLARRQSPPGPTLVDAGVVPESPLPGGASTIKSPVADVVRRPRYRNEAGQLMYAAAGLGQNVYGLFASEQIGHHWELLGTLPPGLAAQGLGSHTGGTVFVATTDGHIRALDSRRGTFLDLPVNLPKPKPSEPQTGGTINRIATLSETAAFALLNQTNLKNNYLLRLEGLKWVVPASAGLPTDQYLYGVECVFQEDRRLVFVATDDAVYMSEDGGESYVRAAAGLPRRPHGADLRLALERETAWLYLSTFGRSVWRAQLHRVHHG